MRNRSRLAIRCFKFVILPISLSNTQTHRHRYRHIDTDRHRQTKTDIDRQRETQTKRDTNRHTHYQDIQSSLSNSNSVVECKIVQITESSNYMSFPRSARFNFSYPLDIRFIAFNHNL